MWSLVASETPATSHPFPGSDKVPMISTTLYDVPSIFAIALASFPLKETIYESGSPAGLLNGFAIILSA